MPQNVDDKEHDKKNSRKPADRVPGVAKGPKAEAAPEFRGGGHTVERCRSCRIASLRLSTSGAPSIEQLQATKQVGYVTVKENEPALTITAGTEPHDCPCTWSLVGIEYVEVLTGAAARLKRQNFQFSQLIETITVDPANARNPYVTVNNCTMTIKIKDINDDLRQGINTGKPLSQGVVVRIGVRVKCGTEPVKLIINIVDA